MGIRTELQLRLPNSPGAAAAVCRLLAGERVNIVAMDLDTSGHLHLIVDNHTRALGVLRDAHRAVTVRDVLYVPVANGPGGATAVLSMLADVGVNVDYIYCGVEGAGAGLVLGVDDPRRAAAAAGV